jgi:hypothetical protein
MINNINQSAGAFMRIENSVFNSFFSDSKKSRSGEGQKDQIIRRKNFWSFRSLRF